jgi:hypothetical protein
MSSEQHPYKIIQYRIGIQYRIDIVTRVPAWAEGSIRAGAEVIRLDHETVVLPGNGQYRLGESYTKFKDYTEPF